jgi:hypothetical protein
MIEPSRNPPPRKIQRANTITGKDHKEKSQDSETSCNLPFFTAVLNPFVILIRFE